MPGTATATDTTVTATSLRAMREGPGTASTEAAPGPSAVHTWAPLITLWIVWGTTYLGTSAMVQTMPPLVAAGSRYLLGGLLLAAIMVVLRGLRVLAISRRQLMNTLFLGLGLITIWASLVALSLQHIPGGIAALIGATVPLWVVLLRVISGQRINWRTSLGVGLGILGVAAMLLPGGIEPVSDESPATIAFWSLVVLIASITYAYFSWRTKSLDLPRNTLTTTVYQLLWGGIAIIIVGLAIGESPFSGPYSPTSWAGFGWLVFASIVGYGVYVYLLQNVPLSLVSTFAFVNPVVAVFLGWLLLGESLTRSVVIGLVVIVSGTALVVVGESRKRDQVTVPEP